MMTDEIQILKNCQKAIWVKGESWGGDSLGVRHWQPGRRCLIKKKKPL